MVCRGVVAPFRHVAAYRGKKYRLGTFQLAEQAAIAYDVATRWVMCFGDFTREGEEKIRGVGVR